MINLYSRFGFFFPILPKDGTETNKNTGQIQPKAITPHLTCGQEAFSWSASLKEGPGARESHGISQWPIDGGKSMPCKFSLFKALAQWSKWNYFHDHFLVGGAITILKNMTSSMGRIIYISHIWNGKTCLKPPTSFELIGVPGFSSHSSAIIYRWGCGRGRWKPHLDWSSFCWSWSFWSSDAWAQTPAAMLAKVMKRTAGSLQRNCHQGKNPRKNLCYS